VFVFSCDGFLAEASRARTKPKSEEGCFHDGDVIACMSLLNSLMDDCLCTIRFGADEPTPRG